MILAVCVALAFAKLPMSRLLDAIAACAGLFDAAASNLVLVALAGANLGLLSTGTGGHCTHAHGRQAGSSG